MDIQDVGLGGMDWTDLSRDRESWLLKAVMNIYTIDY
jgi:hypothetical protein